MKGKSLSERILAEVSGPSWQEFYQEIAAMTNGIQESDPRFKPIMDILDQCDRCFENGDWQTFQTHLPKLKKLCGEKG